MGKRAEHHLTKEYVQIAHKIGPAPYVEEELQIKMTMRSTVHLVEWPASKALMMAKVDREVEQQEFLPIVGENAKKWGQPL
jgi:hypothetical protein